MHTGGRQRIILALAGQSLVVERLAAGRPDAAPTITIIDPDDGTTIHSGTSDLDDVTTTTSAAAGPAQSDPTRIVLTSVQPVPSGDSVTAGRHYLVVGTLGQQEWVPVERVDATNQYAFSTRRLAFDHASGSAFKSARVTYALPSALFATGGFLAGSANLGEGYVARLRFTVATVPQSHDEFFDLVRAPYSFGLATSDLPPGLLDREPPAQRGSGYAPQMARAETRVEWDLRQIGVRLDLVRGRDWLRPMALAAWCCEIASTCAVAPPNWDPERWLDYWERRYGDYRTAAQGGRVSEHYDTDEDGTIGEGEEAGSILSLVGVR